jgi:type I restriction enzyme S subunit
MSKLPGLPEGWCWTTAEAISDPERSITYGVIKLGAEVEDGIPVLRSSNVRHLRLDLGYVKPVAATIEAEFLRTRLRGHEVLVTVRGTLGGVAVAPDACRNFNISREVAMIALVDERLAMIVATFVASPPLQVWMLRRTKGITYQGVNIETLKMLPIPLPPLAEQRRIIAEVERHLSVAETARAAANVDVRRCARLRQSILKWAFEGKLADQDPSDEPASMLLARIRAERAAATTTTNRGFNRNLTASA